MWIWDVSVCGGWWLPLQKHTNSKLYNITTCSDSSVVLMYATGRQKLANVTQLGPRANIILSVLTVWLNATSVESKNLFTENDSCPSVESKRASTRLVVVCLCTTDSDRTKLSSLPPRHQRDRRKAKTPRKASFLTLQSKTHPLLWWTCHPRIYAGDLWAGRL